MRSFVAALSLATFAACASANTGATRLSEAAVEGTYEFSASIPGDQVRGTLSIHPDTILIDEVSGGRCLPSAWTRQVQRDQNVFRYGCEGVLLTFDRRSPTQLSRWSASVPVRRQRSVCAERAVRNGREVCVRTAMEAYEVTESRSGAVQVRRKSP